jgi:hypothetical protein
MPGGRGAYYLLPSKYFHAKSLSGFVNINITLDLGSLEKIFGKILKNQMPQNDKRKMLNFKGIDNIKKIVYEDFNFG